MILALLAASASAADFALRSGSVSAGGGFSQGNNFAVTGVVGEVAAAPSTNGIYTFHSGFLAAMAANQAPVTAPDIVTRSASGDLKISIAQLLANDFDPDTGPLTLQIISPSTAGAGVSVSGNWVYYLHNTTGADSFDYTVTDARGGVATGRVDILINSPDAQFTTLLRITSDAGGAHLRFTGIRTRSYVIQYRDDIGDPWQDLADAIHLGLGRFGLDDANGGPSRFYRAVYRE